MLQQSSTRRDQSVQYIAIIVLLISSQSAPSNALSSSTFSYLFTCQFICFLQYFTDSFDSNVSYDHHYIRNFFSTSSSLPQPCAFIPPFVFIVLQYTEFKVPCILHSLVRSNLQVPQKHCKEPLSSANMHLYLLLFLILLSVSW